eukprot:CAMPEP_0115217176 /NCGR_PEP_ID=MMETSP0270-20121206/25725_1 /TAXON_ID=71861 /ORGANISM="Scrippsiella trochoidea, Strain CCMP3099" /LENGTH=138 /DNA_ID=CAMNT_0002631049 /DNA_START=78 /DNA_END=491 /DNA_ORIENTATION=-
MLGIIEWGGIVIATIPAAVARTLPTARRPPVAAAPVLVPPVPPAVVVAPAALAVAVAVAVAIAVAVPVAVPVAVAAAVVALWRVAALAVIPRWPPASSPISASAVLPPHGHAPALLLPAAMYWPLRPQSTALIEPGRL